MRPNREGGHSWSGDNGRGGAMLAVSSCVVGQPPALFPLDRAQGEAAAHPKVRPPEHQRAGDGAVVARVVRQLPVVPLDPHVPLGHLCCCVSSPAMYMYALATRNRRIRTVRCMSRPVGDFQADTCTTWFSCRHSCTVSGQYR